MKKLHLIIFALFIASFANAQQPIVANKANQKENFPTATQVAEVDQRVKALIKDIESLYSQYEGMSDQWFKDENRINEKFYGKKGAKNGKKGGKNGEKGVKNEQGEQQKAIGVADSTINVIKGKLDWIDKLRDYYENGSLDDLYRGDQQHPKAEVSTLRLHMKLLGKDYPKKMDDLLLLAESAQSLKEEYDAARNKDYRNRLRNMAECDIKWDIDGLLAVHGDIKKEMDNWEEHTLKGLMDKKSYLMNEYGVDLDKDFPYLAEQAWKSIKKTNN